MDGKEIDIKRIRKRGEIISGYCGECEFKDGH